VLDVAKVFKLDWQTVKALIRSTGPDRSACRHAQAKAIGIGEIPIRRGHSYRIVSAA